MHEMLCRERLWRLFVEDIKLERDDPAAASRRGRVSLAGRLQLLQLQLSSSDNSADIHVHSCLDSEHNHLHTMVRKVLFVVAGRTNKGRAQLKDDAGTVTDKAYEREYLAHDRKRIRRD